MADDQPVRRRLNAEGDAERAEAFPEDAIATETTTLLNSETSSQTLRNGSPARSRRGRDTDDDDDYDDSPKHSLSAARAVALILSVWMLIFLQGSSLTPSPRPRRGAPSQQLIAEQPRTPRA